MKTFVILFGLMLTSFYAFLNTDLPAREVDLYVKRGVATRAGCQEGSGICEASIKILPDESIFILTAVFDDMGKVKWVEIWGDAKLDALQQSFKSGVFVMERDFSTVFESDGKKVEMDIKAGKYNLKKKGKRYIMNLR